MRTDAKYVPEYNRYENVTMNIWLYKGSHHFVQCRESVAYAWEKTFVLPNTEGARKTGNADLDNFPALCKDLYTSAPLRTYDSYYDNVKYYVRPLDCELRKSYFRKLEDWGGTDAEFYENCIDFSAGDSKPELRIHGNSTFNITNFAQFENTIFTAEDKLVKYDWLDADPVK